MSNKDMKLNKKDLLDYKEEIKLLREAINLAPNLLAIRDNEGVHIMCNQAYASIFGRSVEEIEKKSIKKSGLNSNFIMSILKEDEQILETNRPKVITKEVQDLASGEIRTLKLMKLPIQLEGHAKKQMLIAGQDITAERKLNAERERRLDLESEMNSARSIQQRLIPKVPLVTNKYQIDGFLETFEAAGGDLYYWKKLENDESIFCLGDVSGHGVGAALVMSQVRTAINLFSEQGKNPSQIMEHLNEMLCSDLPDDKFVTMVLGKISNCGRFITISFAGHGPAYHWIDKKNKFEETIIRNLPLGVISNYTGNEEVIEIQKNDFLLIASDGFYEWPNAKGEIFGNDRFIEGASKLTHLPNELFLASLHKQASEWSKNILPEDDLSALIIRST